MIKKFLFISFWTLIIVASSLAQELYINEFMASNDFAYPDPNGDYDDWIEIYNAENEPIDIGGMYITDDLDEITAWQIPTSAPDQTTIPADGFLVLWADDEPDQGVLHLEIKLSADGEDIGLTAEDGVTIIDQITFGPQTTDVSYGRYPDGSDNWVFMPDFTPGAPNDLGVVLLPVVINEFMANPSSDYDWLEIYNFSDETVDIAEMYLTDNFAYLTDFYQFPTGEDWTEIAANDYLVLILDGNDYGEITLNENGEQIALVDASGTAFVDSVSFGSQIEDVSYSRLLDANTIWTFCPQPTQGTTNVPAPSSGGLFINEFMASNETTIADNFGEYDDWLEIYNDTNTAIDLGGKFLLDTGEELWQIPTDDPTITTIDNNDFLLIWCDNDDDQGTLHATFKLSADGEYIAFLDEDRHTLIDFIEFGEQTTDVSYGRYPDGTDYWIFMDEPTPNSSNVSTFSDDHTSSPAANISLLGNYPNPFNPTTTIAFSVKQNSAFIALDIFNVKGQKVIRLLEEEVKAGKHQVVWNGLDAESNSVGSGLYFYQLQSLDKKLIGRMLLLK